MVKKLFLSFSLLALLILKANADRLRTGTWRATLSTKDNTQLPFNFEVEKKAEGAYKIVISNASEKIEVEEITFSNDSIFFRMPVFDSDFRAKITGGTLHGEWVKHYATTNISMPFFAEHGKNFRFHPPDSFPKENASVKGRWKVQFATDEYISVGEFEQNGTIVTGTFLTVTGDYRYLEGDIIGTTFSLSTFDGSHAFIFKATIDGDSLKDGKFYSGWSYVEDWQGVRDEHAKLPDAYSLTYLKPGYDKLSFSFPNLDGKTVSLSDQQFRNKVIVVQIMGSWCPNCMDETRFLSEFYQKNSSKGFEVIGLSYERSDNFEKERQNVLRMKTRFNVQYTLLLAGVNDRKKVAETLPMLNQVLSFPTSIIIDKKGIVRRIHTGFSGPGTGNHYDKFVEEFETFISKLLQEN